MSGGVEDLLAEVENLGELGAHGLLQIAGLGGGHLLGGVVKDFFGKQTQDDHVVLANRQVGVAGGDDLVDEGGPVVRPLLLEDGNEDEVKLVEQSLLLTQRLFGARALDDEVDNEVSNSWK